LTVTVSEAVAGFLDGRRLKGRSVVLASLAGVLAQQLDLAVEQGSARAMSAVPPLTNRLVEVLNEIEPAVDVEQELAAMVAPLKR
jgi:hypothetical protein